MEVTALDEAGKKDGAAERAIEAARPTDSTEEEKVDGIKTISPQDELHRNNFMGGRENSECSWPRMVMPRQECTGSNSSPL